MPAQLAESGSQASSDPSNAPPSAVLVMASISGWRWKASGTRRLDSALRSAAPADAPLDELRAHLLDELNAFAVAFDLDLLIVENALALDQAVTFLAEAEAGPPADHQLARLCHAADVLLQPSWEEGFGLPILEAAIRDPPIVCSDLPSLHEPAGDAAQCVQPDGGPEALAQAVLAAIARGPSAELAARVREFYSWPTVYARHIAPLLERAAG